jgi:hypothetical protein
VGSCCGKTFEVRNPESALTLERQHSFLAIIIITLQLQDRMSPPPSLLTRHAVDTSSNITENSTVLHPTVTTNLEGVSSSMGNGREGSRDTKICPTDDEAFLPKRKLNKRSPEYIIKSGVAGGLAGCAVSNYAFQTGLTNAL